MAKKIASAVAAAAVVASAAVGAPVINKPADYIGPPVTPKPDDPIGPPIHIDPSPVISQSVQEPDPTGPLEIPTVQAHARLSELLASQVKISDENGNVYYLEASKPGVFVLRVLPKVG